MTLDEFVNLYTKKGLGTRELRDVFLTVLRKGIADNIAALCTAPGVLGAAATFGIGVADKLSIVPTAWRATTGNSGASAGKLLLGSAPYSTDLPFENTVATPYQVAATFAEIPSTVENAKDASTHWGSYQEVVGYAGVPNSVAVQGAGLRVRVDSVCEVGVTCAGRKCWVYLTNPKSLTMGIALELGTVTYVGGQNVVDTVAQFGQTPGAPSLTAGDYTVVLQGPRIMRNTDMSALAGHVLFGTVTGGGAGNVPSASSNALQTTYANLALLTTWCIEIDAHGFPKVTVRADASDGATDPQLSVKNNAGTRKFWVDTSGNVHTDDMGAAAGLDLAATAPDNVIDALLPQTLFGSLRIVANHERLFDAGFTDAILSGCAVSAAAGLTVNIASGVVIAAGKYTSNAAVNGFPVFNNTTQFIVWTGVGYDTVTTSPPFNYTPIAYVTTSGGAVTSVVDLRLFMADLDRRIDVQVGGPHAHFTTLKAAVDMVNSLAAPASGAPNRNFRILVRGSTTETAVIKFEASGVLIQGLPGLGAGAGSNARVSWSGDRDLFDLNGKLDLTFRDLDIAYNDAGAGASSTINRTAFNSTSASGATRVRIENVQIVAVQANRLHGFMRNSGGGTFADFWISHCYWSGASEYGINVTSAQDFRVVDCFFTTSSTTQAGATAGGAGAIKLGGAGNGGIHVRGCRVYGWSNRGIVLNGAEGGRVEACDVQQGTVDGTTTKQVGIELTSTCIRCWVRDCRVVGIGSTAANATGIECAGDRAILHGNDCKVDAGATVELGMDVTAASANCIIDCNQTNGQTLATAGGPHSIGALNRDDA